MTKKIIVAVKDVSQKNIRPGKVLGSFRSVEFARHALSGLARKEGLRNWQIGFFQNGKLLE